MKLYLIFSRPSSTVFEKNEKKRGKRGARRSECDFVGLILATIRVLESDLVGRILAVISAKRDFCNSRFHCVHCSALLPLNITKFLQKKM